MLNPAGQTSVRSEVSEGSGGPHARFAGLWPAGFSKRVASGTQGSSRREEVKVPGNAGESVPAVAGVQR